MFVTVLDVNDNRPIFLQSSYEASVSEDIPEGHSIVQAGDGGWSGAGQGRIQFRARAQWPCGGRETGQSSCCSQAASAGTKEGPRRPPPPWGE